MKQRRSATAYNPLLAYVAILFLLASSLALNSCGGSSSAYDPGPDYSAAVQDTAQPLTASKVSRNLTAITPDNSNLIWENSVAGPRVLVAVWIGPQSACDSYKCPAGGCQPDATCKEGKECLYWRDSWVTVVPEMKRFFNGTAPDPLRVAQLLGLPPSDAARNVCFLEMYVRPADLFRPSPDPEITDHEAETSFPADGLRKFDDTRKVYSEMPYDATRCPNPDGSKCGFTDYRSWFNNRRAYVYSQTNVNSPYPWTGLGYTYDWGNPNPPHIGLSEFVLNGKKADNSTIPVLIKSVTPTADYFQ